MTRQLDDAFLDALAAYGPIGKTLGMVIRPAFVAPKGRTFVWGDWSAIEARVLPWLANSPGAEKVLDIFRTNDLDPSLPDIYKITAGELLHKDPREVTKFERQSHGKVPCIAEGQPVLTDQGLVPIERVTLDMRVWDGAKFVSHQGSVLKGTKDVYEYDGLIATADHLVWTEEVGPYRFLDAARRGYHLLQSGAGRAPIRVGDRADRRAPLHEAEAPRALRADALHELRRREVDQLVLADAGAVEGVSAVLYASADTGVAHQAAECRPAALHEPARPGVPELRGSRHSVPLPLGTGSGAVGRGKPRAAPEHGAGSCEEQRPLRGRQPALGDAAPAELEQAAIGHPGGLYLPRRGVAVRLVHGAAEDARGQDPRAEHSRRAAGRGREAQGLAVYRGKARVYDIVNAGPQHRFTVSNVLVHNCLSLGFGGGVGALQKMAVNYGVYFDEDASKALVTSWRDRNPWAREFWGQFRTDPSGEVTHASGLWGACLMAIRNPGTIHEAGRVAYAYDPDYMGGTLFCALPCGRLLTYPDCRFRSKKVKDKDTGEEKEVTALWYRKGFGWSALWYGKLAENVTQAVAGSIIRETLVALDTDVSLHHDEAYVVGHVHDEIIMETPDALGDSIAPKLKAAMETRPAWRVSLPLVSEVSVEWFYSKAAG